MSGGPRHQKNASTPRCPTCNTHQPYEIATGIKLGKTATLGPVLDSVNGVPAVWVHCLTCGCNWPTRAQSVVYPIVEAQREARMRRAGSPPISRVAIERLAERYEAENRGRR